MSPVRPRENGGGDGGHKIQVLNQNLIPTKGKTSQCPAGYHRHPLVSWNSCSPPPTDPSPHPSRCMVTSHARSRRPTSSFGAHRVPVMPPDRHRRPAV
ncbi:hypothetical protein VZT92_011089 [Zoarces viviparus]|uniref:Uncharacterized protein n=1 Tax=Zoarces viviparus TaxID=48416 RepID=A0AAW1FAK6_ZOAVI